MSKKEKIIYKQFIFKLLSFPLFEWFCFASPTQFFISPIFIRRDILEQLTMKTSTEFYMSLTFLSYCVQRTVTLSTKEILIPWRCDHSFSMTILESHDCSCLNPLISFRFQLLSIWLLEGANHLQKSMIKINHRLCIIPKHQQTTNCIWRKCIQHNDIDLQQGNNGINQHYLLLLHSSSTRKMSVQNLHPPLLLV